MHLRIITKNHAAYPETGFLTKSISKPYGRATAMPPAWELNDRRYPKIGDHFFIFKNDFIKIFNKKNYGDSGDLFQAFPWTNLASIEDSWESASVSFSFSTTFWVDLFAKSSLIFPKMSRLSFFRASVEFEI